MSTPGTPTFKPRYALVDNFLARDLHDALLDHVLTSREQFVEAEVVREGQERLDHSVRRNLHLRNIGPVRDALEAQLRAAAPGLAAAAGVALPPAPSLELELSASGDGAHFICHRDIQVGAERRPMGVAEGEDRLLSAVYYFHRLPRAFSGGALRLYPWGSSAEEAGEDIDPADNRLIAFPSFAEHQVRPVSCPSGAFEDYRFGLNCWFCAPV